MSKANKISILLIFVFAAFSCGGTKKAVRSESKPTISVQENRQFSYFFYEALRQKQQEKYDVAMELLIKCYNINPYDANIQYEMANVFTLTGKISEAISALNEAVTLDNGNLWYKVNLANLYLLTNDLKSATQLYEQTSQQFPEKEELQYNLVELYMKQNRYNDAIVTLNKIEKKIGVAEEISFEKFKIYSNLGDMKKAMKEVDALINKYPNEMRYRILLGNVYFENNELQKALECYNYALQREPDNGYARLSMAEYYEKNGEQEKAIAEMDYALRSKNIDVETKIGILDRYLSMLQNKEEWAKRTPALFETLLEIHPNVIEIHYYYASYLIALGKLDEAVKEFETILYIDPHNLEAWGQIIEINIHKDNMDEVITVTNKAIETMPDLPQWYLYQGIAYFRLDEKEKAIEAYQKGVTLVKEEDKALKSDFYGQMGDIYFEQNEKQKAYDSYDEALRLNHTNAHVLNNYSYYLAEEKENLEKAETMIKICLELTPNSNTVLDTYAWVLFQQGHYYTARRYIEEALKYGGETSDVIIEHYGDVLYMTDEKEEAVNMWKKSLEMGNTSTTLPLKIEQEKYIE